MPAVSGFKHDLFVSYSHADDESVAGAQQGFVTQLVSDLTKEVGRKVGSALDIWWDTQKLAGNSPVTPSLVQAASETAGIILLVSLAYLRSEWCQRERSEFLGALQRRARTGAVFIVAIENVAREKLPLELQDLIGYQFWKLLPDGRTTRALRVDFSSDREPYYDRLSALVQDVANHLASLQAPAPTNGQGLAPVATASPGAPAAAPALLLAEVTDDLVHQREEVKAYLEQLGYSVLPKRRYSRDDIALHDRQLREDLAQAKLFVQLLGSLTGDKSDCPKGLAWLRYETARDVLPTERIVQWRDPQLTIEQVAEPDARELLALPTVRSCNLQELKRAVAELLQSKTRERPASQPGAPKCIFVNADLMDRKFASEVGGWLADKGYVVLEPPAANDPSEWREEWETNMGLCNGLMLVYGETKPRWVTQQFMQSTKVLAQRESPIEMISICVAPPSPEPAVQDKLATLPLRYGAIQYFRCDKGLNPTEMQRFVGQMESHHAA